MPLVPGLVPNIRLQPPEPKKGPGPVSVVMNHGDGDDDEDTGDTAEYDDAGAVIRIDHGDGGVTVSLNGKPLDEPESKGPSGWFDNLAEDVDEAELARIAEDLLRGVEDDRETREEWIEDRAQGIKLMGLKIELPGLQGATDGAPVEGMSRVRHPLLLEAVLRFQANARSELLPTDGPVKIRDDGNGTVADEDRLADALEKDLNHFLTSTATEYYPDTDRMLLLLGFGGTAFKKVYYCPLRNRPASESVDADDLIVNQAATDLQNAKRVTHRIMMRASTVKRMQILGVYRDLDLSQAHQPKTDAVKEIKNAQQGISSEARRPQDRDREIYECYCELDIAGFEHKHKGAHSGLEIPYRVTIDVSSKQILSIVRNYDEDTKELPEARTTFVKYTFVPGLGFYDIGLLHILGNTTNAITAAWRELLDAGMYSNFPGFLFADTGARQNTNIFRVPPGGGAPVKTGGMPINQAIMPLPYKEPSQALMALVTDMAETGMRIGGTSEQQVGEGRADAPVGTTLAQIEQATKVLNAVHKRMHAAQAQEIALLVNCFREHPESFWERNRRPANDWDEQTFLKALEAVELVPQADPNTASHGQRIMKIAMLKQLQAAQPALYNAIAIDKAALQALGWSNPEQFMAPPEAQNVPPPEMQKAMAELQIKKQEADAKTMVAQATAAKAQAEAQHLGAQAQAGPPGAEKQVDTEVDKLLAQAKMMDAQTKQTQAQIDAGRTQAEIAQMNRGDSPPADTQADMITAQARLMDAQSKQQQLHVQGADVAQEDRNRAADRESREKVQLLEMARDLVLHPENAAVAQPFVKKAEGPGFGGKGRKQ